MSQAPTVAVTPPPEYALSTLDIRVHWIFLVASVAIVLLSMTMRIKEQTRVTIPGTEILVPELCMMKVMTQFPCAGCGMTRSFISLGHGDLSAAWRYNPSGAILFSLIAFQIPYRILQLWRIRQGKALLTWGPWLVAVMILGIAIGYAKWLAEIVSYWL